MNEKTIKAVKQAFGDSFDKETYEIIATHATGDHSVEFAIIENVQGVIVVFSVSNDNHKIFEAHSVSEHFITNSYVINNWLRFMQLLEK